MRLRITSLFAIAVTAVCASSSVFALDSASLEFATGNKTKMLRAGLQSNWDNQWFSSNGTHVGGYWDATLAQWQGNSFQGKSGATQNLTDIGITPVFRFQNDSKKGFYGEAGIGLHMLSEIYDNNSRHFSTNFQFGDHIGVGYLTKEGWDLSFKIQHYSNGGVKHPNPGVNFAVLKAGYAF
ncbi:acyloxyacyl hydrolase [Undibacterium sp. Di26W]|uniref:acyloxyacyl hydrolase n=1 Tax=Undibacterium sp. Di26W TaxID=3413035 RepID=UPI003BF15E4D